MTETALQGSFGKLALESLVRFLAANGLEGVLDLRTPTGEHGAIEIARGQVIGAFWGQAVGEPALVALVAATPTEFRFRSAPQRPANLTGEISALFARAQASGGAQTAADPLAPAVDLAALDAPTTMVTVASADPRIAEASKRGILAPRPKPLAPQRARTIGSVWKPGDLVALANALIAEYADGGYGGLAWDRDLGPRVRRVDAAHHLAPALPLAAGRIDGVALMAAAHSVDTVVPYLRAVVREIYREADRGCGGSAARRGYRSAVQKLWGPSDELWAEAVRMVETDTELRAHLTLTRGLDPRTIELVERDYSFGRGSANDVVLKHQTVSRRHATITPRQGRFVLKDLASTSGTLVNGKPITEERELSNGDVIEMGQVLFRFELLS